MVLELTRFRLRDGGMVDEFVRLDQQVQTELYPNASGYLRRTVARNPAGDWIVVVLFGSYEDASAFAAAKRDDPLMREFTSRIDGATLRVERYEDLGG